jgi:hypothetical protein
MLKLLMRGPRDFSIWNSCVSVVHREKPSESTAWMQGIQKLRPKGMCPSQPPSTPCYTKSCSSPPAVPAPAQSAA